MSPQVACQSGLCPCRFQHEVHTLGRRVLAEASPTCRCGRSNKGTQSETSGRAGGEGGLPHDPHPVPKARTAWQVHSLTLASWRTFRANRVGFFSSVLGCLFFVIKHTEEVVLIFNSSCKEEVFVPSLFCVSDSQLGG